MKYPYIGQCKENLLTVLFYQRNSGTTLSCGNSDIAEVGKFETGFSEREFKNITLEYLANTYGKIESKEHAEFIVKLAENAGFNVGSYFLPDLFCFSEYNLFFYESELIANAANGKQICIPSPPKEPEIKEWPQVGAEVLVGGGNPAKVIGLYGAVAWIKYTNSDYAYDTVRVDAMYKPKTPEEELRDELMDATINSMSDDSYDLTHNAYYLISNLMEKYKITKKPR